MRLLYWSLVIVFSFLIGRAVWRLTARWLGAGRDPVLVDVARVGQMTVAFTPVLWGLNLSLLRLAPGAGAGIAELAFYVAAITAGICIFRRSVPGFEEDGYFGSAALPEAAEPRLVRRLPAGFRGPILRLTVRDHMVDVIAQCGSYPLRLRFGDAIDEMDAVAGYCTHRSHWVARAAIAGVERRAGRVYLRLVNGDLVPVSRKYRPDLKAAGVI